jgi:hypothetical protein
VITNGRTAKERKSGRNQGTAALIDDTLEDSFPASDPPSWTASVATPAPVQRVPAAARDVSSVRQAVQRVAALF